MLQVVLPLLELVVELLGIIDDDAVEHAAENSSLSMRRDLSTLPFSLGVAGIMQVWRMPRSRTCQQKPVRGLGTVVCMDRLSPERQPLQHVVRELDGGLLVVPRADAQHPDAGAVVDGGELVVLLGGDTWDRGDELDADLHLVAGLGLLRALPALFVALVALVGRQTVHTQAVEHPPHARFGHLDVVIALQHIAISSEPEQ